MAYIYIYIDGSCSVCGVDVGACLILLDISPMSRHVLLYSDHLVNFHVPAGFGDGFSSCSSPFWLHLSASPGVANGNSSYTIRLKHGGNSRNCFRYDFFNKVWPFARVSPKRG